MKDQIIKISGAVPGAVATRVCAITNSLPLSILYRWQVLALSLLLALTLLSVQPALAQEATEAKPQPLPQNPPPIAPDYKAPVRPLPPGERVGVDAQEQKPLTLFDAIALALENNRDINASRIDTEIARFGLKASQGAFDPRLTTENRFQRQTSPVASLIGGGVDGKLTQSDFVNTARVSGASPYFGSSYQMDFTSTRQTTNNSFTSLNPTFPSALTFSLTQPLWRGLRIDNNRRQLAIAKKNLSLSDSQFRQRAIDVITRVQQSYWDLTFALRNLQVQLDAVKQARSQVESNNRQVAQGILAPIDVVSAETQVATFEQNVYAAQEAVTRAENMLKTLLLPNRGAALWSQAILPVTPVSLNPPNVPLDQAVQSALRHRPEIEQLTTNSEINEIDTKFFRDQTKPQIDLVASYSSAGLAGDPVASGPNPLTASFGGIFTRLDELSKLAGLPPLPPTTSTDSGIPGGLLGGYGQSLNNLFAQRYPTTQVGVRITLPFGNRTAEANLGRSLAEGRQIQNQRAMVEQQIEADVRNATQALRSADARLQAAAAATTLAERQSDGEQRKFQAGLSTVFLVLQRQTDLVGARGRELQAQTDLNKALADYQRAVGSTLEVNQISVTNDQATPRLERQAATSNK